MSYEYDAGESHFTIEISPSRLTDNAAHVVIGMNGIVIPAHEAVKLARALLIDAGWPEGFIGGMAYEKSEPLVATAIQKLFDAQVELSRESEAAARQARRDELVHQYGYELTYADQSPMVKDLINRLISANADHTVASEADDARLKGEGR